MKLFYKGTRLDGWDFYTGKTINYRENIGKTVKVPEQHFNDKPFLCSPSVIHASRNANDIFVGSSIPCSVFRVKGKPLVSDGNKSGFKKLSIIEEIPQKKLDDVFGWQYSEACNPINPFKISPPQITNKQIELVRNWASLGVSIWNSVRDSLGASVGYSLRDSIWASVGYSLRDSIWASVGYSLRDSIWASVGYSLRDSLRDPVWASIWDSVWDSIWAYMGSLFHNIKNWKYIKHKKGEYPFQPCVDLWKIGLVPSFDGIIWRLHGGKNAKILWEDKS